MSLETKGTLQGEEGGVLRLDVRGAVAVVTVCREEVRNALDFETMFAWKRCIEALQAHPNVCAVVLCGEGEKAFISGGDLKALASVRGQDGGRMLSEVMGDVLWEWERLPQVTIAAIQGDAFGGGVEVALACDLRVVGSASRLGLTQGRFRVTTGWGGAHRLVRLVGYARALEWLLDCKVLSAQEALGCGLANAVVEESEVLSEALRRAEQIAGLGAGQVRGVKEVVRAGATLSADEAAWIERQTFAKRWASKEHEDAVEAFVNRKT